MNKLFFCGALALPLVAATSRASHASPQTEPGATKSRAALKSGAGAPQGAATTAKARIVARTAANQKVGAPQKAAANPLRTAALPPASQRVAATVQLAPAPAATLEKLPNGVTLATRPDHLSPRAAISLVLNVGAADETPETAGWRRLLVNAMLRSAPQGYEVADASGVEATEALPRAAEKAGGLIGATVGDDFIEIFVSGEAQNAPKLLDLALALWQHPRLSDADIQGARERAQGQADADDLDTAAKTQAALRSQLFRDARGNLTAYGLPEYGTSQSLAGLTDEKLRALFATQLATARLTVAATGDFDAAALRQKLEDLPARAPRTAAVPTFASPHGGNPALVVRELPVPSAWVFVSYPLAGNTGQDAPALRVLAAALGDSGAARLPARLLKAPLGATPPAISVASQFIPRRYAGELVLFAQTGPQSVERVKNALLDEVHRLQNAPLSPLELRSAITYARGSWSVDRQNLRERAFQTALSPALDGPPDTSWPARLQTVTSADVQRVAKKYFGPYAVALVMPGE